MTEYQGASAAAIQHHYDIGNEFYQLFLDPTLTYSCALFDDTEGADTLERAQLRKIDWHIAHARAAGKPCVLEVGCGWGSVLGRLRHHHGVERAVGLTLSAAQVAWIAAHPVPGVEPRLENWFDHTPRQPYDAIITIGAIEAFARPGLAPDAKLASYTRFFERCHGWLRPGGSMSVQAIVYENTRRGERSPFMQTDIFPESDVPRIADLAQAVEGRFEIESLRCDRAHYERTCRAWLANLKARRDEAVALVGEARVATYEKYFKMCIVGFHIARVNLVRMALRRLDNSFWSLPAR